MPLPFQVEHVPIETLEALTKPAAFEASTDTHTARRYAAAFTLLLGTMLSPREVAELEVGAWRPDGADVVVISPRATFTARQKTDHRAREVPVLEPVAERIRELLGRTRLAGSPGVPLLGSFAERPLAIKALGSAFTGASARARESDEGQRMPITISACQDAVLRELYACDRGLGHIQHLLGLPREPKHVGVSAAQAKTRADLRNFMEMAHPWGTLYLETKQRRREAREATRPRRGSPRMTDQCASP